MTHAPAHVACCVCGATFGCYRDAGKGEPVTSYDRGPGHTYVVGVWFEPPNSIVCFRCHPPHAAMIEDVERKTLAPDSAGLIGSTSVVEWFAINRITRRW